MAGLFLAIFRCVGIAAFGALLMGASPAKVAPDKSDSAQNEFARTVAIPKSTESEPCGQYRYTSNDDLCAEWKAADAASDAARYALLTLIVSAIGTGLLVWTLAETRGTARRELRAYIGVEDVTTTMDRLFNVDGLINIQNFGQSPAYNLSYSALISIDKSISHKDLTWDHACSQFLAPTQKWGLPVNADAVWVPGEKMFLVCEIRFDDVFERKHRLLQRYVSTDGRNWHSDNHGNEEVSD